MADEDGIAGTERHVEMGRDPSVDPDLPVAQKALDGAPAAVCDMGKKEGQEGRSLAYGDALATRLTVVGLGTPVGAEGSVRFHSMRGRLRMLWV